MATIAKKLQTIAENQQKVFEAGKAQGGGDSYYDTFWDSYQKNGNRYHWNSAFANQAWDDVTYNPKHPFREIRYGGQIFQNAQITDTLFPMNFTTLAADAGSIFRYCSSLITIRTLTVAENTTFVFWFTKCTALKNITFEGVIGQNLDVHYSTLLTAESYHSIVTHFSKTASFTATLPAYDTVKSVYDTVYGEGAWDAITAEYGNVTFAYS